MNGEETATSNARWFLAAGVLQLTAIFAMAGFAIKLDMERDGRTSFFNPTATRDRLITKQELAQHGPTAASVWISICGHVYDGRYYIAVTICSAKVDNNT